MNKPNDENIIQQALKQAVRQFSDDDTRKVLDEILRERQYQQHRWGNEFDKKNNANDWIAYITAYLGKCWEEKFNPETYRANMVKVATLAVAAIETYDRLDGNVAKPHYE